ncbi:MAG: cupin domain-containing protein [Candidatus Latescibacterota bacterium]|jgi:mannose-6-phosphate isomerase-like protein (cupin superfamily)
MTDDKTYNINKDISFGGLELIDIPRLMDECDETWFNQTLCRVNDCVVRLGIIHGEFHWHKHDEEDEVFYVIEGKLLVDLEDKTFELSPRQSILVPRGVAHRTRAPEKTAILMIEGSGVEPTGD